MMLEELLWDAMLKQRNAHEGTTEVDGGLNKLHVAGRSEVSCDSVICDYLQADLACADT